MITQQSYCEWKWSHKESEKGGHKERNKTRKERNKVKNGRRKEVIRSMTLLRKSAWGKGEKRKWQESKLEKSKKKEEEVGSKNSIDIYIHIHIYISYMIPSKMP